MSKPTPLLVVSLAAFVIAVDVSLFPPHDLKSVSSECIPPEDIISFCILLTTSGGNFDSFFASLSHSGEKIKRGFQIKLKVVRISYNCIKVKACYTYFISARAASFRASERSKQMSPIHSSCCCCCAVTDANGD
jgi:hypothetical protein